MPDSFATPRTVVHQAPLSMGFSSQEYLSGLPFFFLGDLPGSRIKPESPALGGEFFTTEPSGKPFISYVLPLSILLRVNISLKVCSENCTG